MFRRIAMIASFGLLLTAAGAQAACNAIRIAPKGECHWTSAWLFISNNYGGYIFEERGEIGTVVLTETPDALSDELGYAFDRIMIGEFEFCPHKSVYNRRTGETVGYGCIKSMRDEKVIPIPENGQIRDLCNVVDCSRYQLKD